MATESADVIVLGAGVAVSTAARLLGEAGLRVLLLEARNRIGGRVWTIHSSEGVPVELGAEFIHGRPRNIFEAGRAAHLELREFTGSQWVQVDGKLQPSDNFFARVQSVMARMDSRPPDHSFAKFLDDYEGEEEAKLWGLEYVEGFHGAIAERISVHSLVLSRKAEQAVEGDRSFRLSGGYAELLGAMQAALPAALVQLRLNTTVQAVDWGRHQVRIHALSNGEPVDLWRSTPSRFFSRNSEEAFAATSKSVEPARTTKITPSHISARMLASCTAIAGGESRITQSKT